MRAHPVRSGPSDWRPVVSRRRGLAIFVLAVLATLLPACGTTTTSAPVAVQPLVPAPAAAVEEPPAEPPAEPPEAADLCTDDGWCRPFVAMLIDSVAATTEAVAVGTKAGTVALWADGLHRSRDRHVADPVAPVEAVEVERRRVPVVGARTQLQQRGAVRHDEPVAIGGEEVDRPGVRVDR